MITIGSPQPTYTVPSLDTIPDIEEDRPVAGKELGKVEGYDLPPLIYGAATLSTIYNVQDDLETSGPFRAVRLALRYGIDSFDTSPYYGASEIILGQILQSLRPEFPRESYTLITKCGRYGPTKDEFDYSPETIRKSVQRSLSRLGTDYLDVVYLHDVEFVASPICPVPNEGVHTLALTDEAYARQWGLAPGQEGTVHGEGDQKILDAYAELVKMKEEGTIRSIGISGYPLPTLLRLALLILHYTGKPIDIILSFSHYNFQNTAFDAFRPAFRSRARVGRFLTAAPFSMGLLTNSPPAWHPAPQGLLDLVRSIRESDQVKAWFEGFPNLVLGHSFRLADVPHVVGLSTTKEVHEAVAVWREVHVHGAAAYDRRKQLEDSIRARFEREGWADRSWSSGGM